MKLAVQDCIVVDGKGWKLGRRVLDAHLIGNRVLAVFDYMSFPKDQQAKNLTAYDLNQNLLWVAEDPTNENTDTYVNIMQETPLKVWNFACFVCEIDITTGKLPHAKFTK